MTRSLLRHALTAAGVGILLVPLGATAAQASPSWHHQHKRGPVVVVSGLNNPRQLSLVNGVKLLIAEAGKGGPTAIQTPEGPGFLGTTGSISAVWFPQLGHDRRPHRIVTGLLSSAEAPDGSFAVGSDGVSARHLGAPVYIQETFFPPESLPAGTKKQNGTLLKLRHGSLRPVANITKFEIRHDPDGHGIDSNPYAVLAVRGGQLVADAAANDVLFVNRHGHIRVFHVFPNVTTGACANQEDPPGFPGCNFVPTSLATDRWGHVYVGGLSSLTPGEAQVVKLDRSGRHVLHRWGGFTAVTGLAVGRHGTLYVSQLFADEAAPPVPQVQGVVTKIDHRGHRTNVDVPFPAGLALDRHGNLFVSAFSIAPAAGLGAPGLNTSGQVWRLRF